MPLVTPALRLCLLFLNVYDTFKTLKPPIVSSRTGRVSVRASSQRKRDMKGCLAVWIVWSCLAAYDRTVDGMVRFFIPFYDEIKSIILLFLIVSRARGAEPIFLHVIRPIVKPYVITLDALLEGAHMIGDLLQLLLRFPMQALSSWWHSTQWGEFEDSPRASDEEGAEYLGERNLSRGREQLLPDTGGSSARQTRSQSSRRQPLASSSTINPDSGIAHAANSPPTYEIWHPPPAYSEHVPSGLPAESRLPVNSAPSPSCNGLPIASEEDWRSYPAFPSAYPPTPLPSASKLPPLARAPPSISGLFPLSSEDEQLPREHRPPDPSSEPRDNQHAPEWDFERSLQNRPESENPDSDTANWSETKRMKMRGVRVETVQDGVDGAETELRMDVDEASDDSEVVEDSFDITLRTPPHSLLRARQLKPARASYSPDETPAGERACRPPSIVIDSRATSLTTLDNRLSARSFTDSSDTAYPTSPGGTSLKRARSQSAENLLDVQTERAHLRLNKDNGERDSSAFIPTGRNENRRDQGGEQAGPDQFGKDNGHKRRRMLSQASRTSAVARGTKDSHADRQPSLARETSTDSDAKRGRKQIAAGEASAFSAPKLVSRTSTRSSHGSSTRSSSSVSGRATRVVRASRIGRPTSTALQTSDTVAADSKQMLRRSARRK